MYRPHALIESLVRKPFSRSLFSLRMAFAYLSFNLFRTGTSLRSPALTVRFWLLHSVAAPSKRFQRVGPMGWTTAQSPKREAKLNTFTLVSLQLQHTKTCTEMTVQGLRLMGNLQLSYNLEQA